MTAEVVVMNRLGIALASDSAASVLAGGKTKLYHADKLFMLSGAQPVAAMIYNNSSLLDVPWETIIKLYRAKLGSTKLDRLEDYAKALIAFLNDSVDLFPADVQKSMFLHSLRVFFRELDEEISKAVLRRAVADGKYGHHVIAQAIDEVVGQCLAQWQASDDHIMDGFPADTGDRVVGLYSGEVNKLIHEIFNYGLNAIQSRSLFEIARLIVQKQRMLPEALSGLVIAGFGEKEHFPVAKSFEIGGVFNQKLKYREVETFRVNGEKPAVIKAFAQSEMVEAFLYGASPALYKTITEEVSKVLLGASDLIIDGLPRVAKKRKEVYRAHVRDVTKDTVIDLFRELQVQREKLHYEPVLASIAHLPKNELAHVAATLVNLSSFQKRVSISEDETVGGPVDVAVITKGDGFIWVERKHYFKPELNSHFFRNRAGVNQENDHDRAAEQAFAGKPPAAAGSNN